VLPTYRFVWVHQDEDGYTALMQAARLKLTSVVRPLLELGAKAELTDQVPANSKERNVAKTARYHKLMQNYVRVGVQYNIVDPYSHTHFQTRTHPCTV